MVTALTLIRKARAEDAHSIHALIERFASQDAMLHRSPQEVLRHLGDYCVAEEEGRVVGCCSVHVCTRELAEIKALAVDPSMHGRGLGRQLVEACEEEARRLGIPKLFCLTYVPDFFAKLGYRLVEKATLPYKVWTECIYCNKYPDCGELAMVKRLDGKEEPTAVVDGRRSQEVPEALLRIMASSGRPPRGDG